MFYNLRVFYYSCISDDSVMILKYIFEEIDVVWGPSASEYFSSSPNRYL